MSTEDVLVEMGPVLEVVGWSFHVPKEATHLTDDEIQIGVNSRWPGGAGVVIERRPDGEIYIINLGEVVGAVDEILDAWYDLFLFMNDNFSIWKTYPGRMKLHYFDSEGNIQTIDEPNPRADMEDAIAELLEEAGRKFEECK